MSTHFRVARAIPRYVAPAAGGSFATVAAALTPSAWYRLGDAPSSSALADSSGNGHAGTVGTGITFGTTGLVAGDSDTAATLVGGTNSMAQVAYASWMDAPSALSLFAIGKTTYSGLQAMLSRDSQLGGTRIWQLRLNSGKFEFVKIAGGVVTASTSGTYADGSAHDFGATYDGSNIRLYVDGTKVVTQAATGSLGTLGCPLFVGSVVDASSHNSGWTGVEDEVLYKAGAVWADSDFAALHAARI